MSYNLSYLTDFDLAKEKICYRMINTARNKDFLIHTPHVEILDLSAVFFCLISEDGSRLSAVQISEWLISLWHTDAEALFGIATENTPKLLPLKIMGLEEAAVKASGNIPSDEPPDEKIYILTNSASVFGAAAMFYKGAQDRCAPYVGEDFYILPSSVHEVLLVNRHTKISEDSLKSMVRNVNRTVLRPEDILSDEVYRYSLLSEAAAAICGS